LTNFPYQIALKTLNYPIAQAADVMPAYLYMMGDDSTALNGQVIAAQ